MNNEESRGQIKPWKQAFREVEQRWLYSEQQLLEKDAEIQRLKEELEKHQQSTVENCQLRREVENYGKIVANYINRCNEQSKEIQQLKEDRAKIAGDTWEASKSYVMTGEGKDKAEYLKQFQP
jgi:predicted RNase H-like nuclease (RuvC/YqgF family)